MSRTIFTREEDGRKIVLIGEEVGDREIYIDGAWGLTFNNGICKINLFTIAPESDESVIRREIAVRLTMLASTMFALRDYLDEQCRSLLERGVIKVDENAASNDPGDPKE